MITIHYHLPGSPDVEEYAVNALSDSEAVSLPLRYCDPDAHERIDIVNELAFDAFRLAVASDKISPANIRYRAHTPKGIVKGTFNEFGVPLKDVDDGINFASPGCDLSEQILLIACQKSKRRRMEKLRVLEAERDAAIAVNCKGIEHETEQSSPPSVG